LATALILAARKLAQFDGGKKAPATLSAGRIREGYRLHPRHWLALAQLVGVSGTV